MIETKIETQIIKELKEVLDNKFAKDIVVLDISDISVLSDYFIIVSADNENQIKAIEEATEEYLSKNNLYLQHKDGLQRYTGKDRFLWSVLDFGSIMVHIFDKESRSFYQLERLWADAGVVEIK